MRKTTFVLVTAIATACSAPTIEGTPLGASAPFGTPQNVEQSPSGPGTDPDLRTADGGTADGGRGAAAGGGPGAEDGPDSDGDGVPDAYDCDPQSSKLGGLIVQDDLATAKGLIAAAPGFDPSGWAHGVGGYRQDALRDASDASFFKTAVSPNVVVEVRAASTKTGVFTPVLHQDFVVVGASAAGGQFSAFGCGVEFVEGSDPMGVASIVHLDGPIGAIRTTPLKRVGRPFLPTNEEFGLSLRLENGKLACTVVQGQTPLTVSADVGAVTGAVGLYTHQAASIFKAVRICQVR